MIDARAAYMANFYFWNYWVCNVYGFLLLISNVMDDWKCIWVYEPMFMKFSVSKKKKTMWKSLNSLN